MCEFSQSLRGLWVLQRYTSQSGHKKARHVSKLGLFPGKKSVIRKLGAPKMAKCNTCVVDQVVLDIVGQALPGIKTLLELGMCNVARHNQSPTQREPRFDRVLGERRTDLHKYEIISHRLQSVHIPAHRGMMIINKHQI